MSGINIPIDLVTFVLSIILEEIERAIKKEIDWIQDSVIICDR